MDWRTGFTHDAVVRPGQSVRVVFGTGALATVPDEARALGTPVLVIAGAHDNDAAASVTSDLGDDGVGRLDEVRQHVPVDLADSAIARCRDLGAGCLVAIGGGSATGLAKAVARATGLPVLAVPTTYAGSEMTSVWGLTGPAGKRTGVDPTVLPRTVVYDPGLTRSLPPRLAAASGLNAIAHALESLYAPDADDGSNQRAGLAIRTLGTALPRVVEGAKGAAADEALTQALYGAWLAGWALGSTTMGLQHKLAHVLGGRFDLPHADTHGVLLPHVAEVTAPGAPAAFGLAAEACGASGPDAVAPTLFDLATRLGAPTSLEALGLEHDDIPAAVAAAEGMELTHPVPVTADLLGRLLDDAWHGLRP
jgi:maleylacetate reductase